MENPTIRQVTSEELESAGIVGFEALTRSIPWVWHTATNAGFH